MLDLHIKFNSIEELKNITDVLVDKGLKQLVSKSKPYDFDKCVVSVFSSGCEFLIINNPMAKRTNLTYQQFMEKYGMTDLKGKIEEAKNKTHMSLHQLSKSIGFNEHYLSAVVKRNRSESTQKKVIALLDDLIQKSQQELTHDFQGKALNTQVEDAMMISKFEYNGLNKSINDLNNVNADLFNANSVKDFQINQLKKELDHKTQVAEKHADMRNKAELRVNELEKECNDKDEALKHQLVNSSNQVFNINELEHEIRVLSEDLSKFKKESLNLKEKLDLSEQDSEKWQCDYWTVSRENVELINSKRCISICLAVSILIIVLMAVYEVLHFNGVV